MKAVVLEKSGSCYTVLGKNGSFRQVHRRLNAEVGEEIEISTGIEGFNRLRVGAGVAALFFLVFTTFLGWNLYQAPTAVALLSVDINPSLQFTLDSQGHLLELQTQNEDAKRMLSQIDLRGKPIDEVLEQIVTQAVNQKFLNSEQHWVVVGYSPMNDKTSAQMPKELNENQIIARVTEIVEEKGFTPQVAVFPMTSQDRELAQKGQLTLGEYALWQTAQKAGVVTQQEKLKETSEQVRILENPQVQAQIKAEKKVVESGLPRMPGTSKQDSGSKGKRNEKGTSPVKVPNPVIEKRRGPVEENQNQKKDWQKEKDQGHTNNLDKFKNSEHTETDRAKDQHNVYVPVLAPRPTPGNSKQNASQKYKIPERQHDGANWDKNDRDGQHRR